MRTLLTLLGFVGLASCSFVTTPPVWHGIQFPDRGFYDVEDNSNDHGLYLVYRDREHAELFASIEGALAKAGFTKVGVALEGRVVGYEKGDTRLAMKVDQIAERAYVAVFDRNGKEPLLHMLAFGEATVGETITGESARERLLKEVE